MSKIQLFILGVVQVVVIVFLTIAIISQQLIWYLATAGAVTGLALLAVLFALKVWQGPGNQDHPGSG